MADQKSSKSIRTIRSSDGSVSYGTQVRVTGFKPVYRSFPTKAELIVWRDKITADLREQRKQGNVRPDSSSANLAALNADYLADPETLTLGDYEDRKRQLGWWSAEYGIVKAREFGVIQIREARNNLLAGKGRVNGTRNKWGAGKPREPGTVGRYLAAQRAAWNWARNAGYGLTNPWPTGVMLTEPKARVRYLSDEELLAVKKAAASHSPVMYHAITIAITTGARQSEQFNLTWGDVDCFLQNTVRLIETKNGSSRGVHLTGVARAAFTALRPENAKPADRVFIDAKTGEWITAEKCRARWRRIRTAAGIKNFRWHDLRHCCASFLAQNGSTLLEIGHVLGHKTASATLKYTHLVESKPVTGHAGMDAKMAASAKAAAAEGAPVVTP